MPLITKKMPIKRQVVPTHSRYSDSVSLLDNVADNKHLTSIQLIQEDYLKILSVTQQKKKKKKTHL